MSCRDVGVTIPRWLVEGLVGWRCACICFCFPLHCLLACLFRRNTSLPSSVHVHVPALAFALPCIFLCRPPPDPRSQKSSTMDHGSLARPSHHPPNLCVAPHEMSSPNEQVTDVTSPSVLPDPDSAAAAPPLEALLLNLQNGGTVSHLPCAGNGNTRTATSSISNQALEVDSGGPPSSDGESHRDTARSPNAGSPPSSAVSQRSHVFDFVVEQGRTFHRYREGKYPLPNDNRE